MFTDCSKDQLGQIQNGTQSVLTLNSRSRPSRDQKSFSAALVVSHPRKAEHNEVEENRAELVTPLRCHSVFKVPVVPSAYLRPVNLTQPSSREDLGSNKGLTPRSPGLRLCWRRWLASPRPPSLLTPSLPLPCLSLSSPSLLLRRPLCPCILFSLLPLFVTFFILFLTFTPVLSSSPLSPFFFFFFNNRLHHLFFLFFFPPLPVRVSLFLAFAHIFKFFLISISLSYPLLSVVLALPPLRLHPSSPSTSRL